jgi:SAM-dependent methyltransferase
MKIGWLAPWYRWIEYAAFGTALEDRRFAFLPYLADARNILILGEGDGRTLERVLAQAPVARIDVIEKSAEMIELARQRAGNQAHRVRFLCQDALTGELPGAPYDAIVTLFFLDCFEERDARCLIRRLAASLGPEGVWLLSEFAIPDRGWRRWHAQLWVGTMYRFFGVATGLQTQALPPIERLMTEAGLRRTERQQTRAGLIISEVWTASGMK